MEPQVGRTSEGRLPSGRDGEEVLDSKSVTHDDAEGANAAAVACLRKLLDCDGMHPHALFLWLVGVLRGAGRPTATSPDEVPPPPSLSLPEVPNPSTLSDAFIRLLRERTEPCLRRQRGSRGRTTSMASIPDVGPAGSPSRSPLFPPAITEASPPPPHPSSAAMATKSGGGAPKNSVTTIGFGPPPSAASTRITAPAGGVATIGFGSTGTVAGGGATVLKGRKKRPSDANHGGSGSHNSHSTNAGRTRGQRSHGGGGGSGRNDKRRARTSGGNGFLALGDLLEARLQQPQAKGQNRKRRSKRRIRATPVEDGGSHLPHAAAFGMAPQPTAKVADAPQSRSSPMDWGELGKSKPRTAHPSPHRPPPPPVPQARPPTASAVVQPVPIAAHVVADGSAGSAPSAADVMPDDATARSAVILQVPPRGASSRGSQDTVEDGLPPKSPTKPPRPAVASPVLRAQLPRSLPPKSPFATGGARRAVMMTPSPSPSPQHSLRGVAIHPLTEVVSGAAALSRAAAVYAALIVSRTVPSLSCELQLLAELLTLDAQVVAEASMSGDSDMPRPVATPTRGASLAMVLEARPETSFALPWDTEHPGCSCVLFACEALSFMLPLLSVLGVTTLKLISEHPLVSHVAPSLCEDVSRVVQTMEERSMGPDGGAVMGIHVDNSLPFRPETDSRHHFRTRQLTSLYQNREATRDAFLQLHAEWTELSNAINPRALQQYKTNMPVAARKFLAEIRPENRGWFAQFFVEQLVTRCTGSHSTEQDTAVRKLAKNKRKLQLLHQRMSDRSVAANYDVGSRSGGVPSSSRSDRDSVVSVDVGGDDFGGTMFPGPQDFFRLFLEACDSYSLNTRVVTLLAACLTELSVPRSPAELSRRLASRVARLRLLGKFLGYLLFSPQWSSTSDVYATGSLALQTDIHDAVASADRVQPVVDLRRMLRTADRDQCLVLVMPWIAEVVSMMRMDAVSARTKYYSGLLSDLRELRWSSTLAPPSAKVDASSFTPARLAVLLQLDTLFEQLGTPPAMPDASADGASSPRPGESRSAGAGTGAGASAAAVLDEYPTPLSHSFLMKCAPRLAVVHKLLAMACRRGSTASHAGSPRATPRKIRPMSLQSSFASAAAFSAALVDDHAKRQPQLAHQSSTLKLTVAIAGGAGGGEFRRPPSAVTAPHSGGDEGGAGAVLRQREEGAGKGVGKGASAAGCEEDALLESKFGELLAARHLQERPHLQRLVDVVVESCTHNAATAATEHCVPRVIAAALKLHAQRRRSGSRRSRNDFVRTWSLDAARSAAAEFAMHHAESAARSALETLLPPDLDADIRRMTASVAAEMAGVRAQGVATTRVVAAMRRRLGEQAAEESDQGAGEQPLVGAQTGQERASTGGGHSAEAPVPVLVAAACSMHKAQASGPVEACFACQLLAV